MSVKAVSNEKKFNYHGYAFLITPATESIEPASNTKDFDRRKRADLHTDRDVAREYRGFALIQLSQMVIFERNASWRWCTPKVQYSGRAPSSRFT
jgi:hypothetical protein